VRGNDASLWTEGEEVERNVGERMGGTEDEEGGHFEWRPRESKSWGSVEESRTRGELGGLESVGSENSESLSEE
jgi:hypothetical protein